MAITKDVALQQAISVVNAALQGQSIKLTGAHMDRAHAEKYGASDAAYLSKLLTDLATAIKAASE